MQIAGRLSETVDERSLVRVRGTDAFTCGRIPSTSRTRARSSDRACHSARRPEPSACRVWRCGGRWRPR